MRALILLLLSSLFLVVTPVFAAPNIGLDRGGTAQQIAARSGYGPADTLTFSQSLGKFIQGAMALLGTIFFILTIYAGILWMTAQGNDEQVGTAKSILTMAIIGLVIVMAAYGITTLIYINAQWATSYSG